ncbi:hypothetical protein HU200_007811 [Digitaria exilis]|uniref:Uncharacterized protein n=1 Tax=Digitaria exilis TaxID=1010633 RepID=A0A835FNZ6_9POAL|nr:hypothetical protein HU200_007811 [Digitaria exilis]CAB3474292.1 unnamed protein product [Digitaria exilis]
MAHPDLPLLHRLLFEEGVVEIKDTRGYDQHGWRCRKQEGKQEPWRRRPAPANGGNAAPKCSYLHQQSLHSEIRQKSRMARAWLGASFCIAGATKQECSHPNRPRRLRDKNTGAFRYDPDMDSAWDLPLFSQQELMNPRAGGNKGNRA